MGGVERDGGEDGDNCGGTVSSVGGVEVGGEGFDLGG